MQTANNNSDQTPKSDKYVPSWLNDAYNGWKVLDEKTRKPLGEFVKEKWKGKYGSEMTYAYFHRLCKILNENHFSEFGTPIYFPRIMYKKKSKHIVSEGDDNHNNHNNPMNPVNHDINRENVLKWFDGLENDIRIKISEIFEAKREQFVNNSEIDSGQNVNKSKKRKLDTSSDCVEEKESKDDSDHNHVSHVSRVSDSADEESNESNDSEEDFDDQEGDPDYKESEEVQTKSVVDANVSTSTPEPLDQNKEAVPPPPPVKKPKKSQLSWLTFPGPFLGRGKNKNRSKLHSGGKCAGCNENVASKNTELFPVEMKPTVENFNRACKFCFYLE